MSSFSWFIFSNKIANSALVLGVCWYLIRTYLQPFIKKTMNDRLAFSVDLQNFAHLQKQENEALLNTIKQYEQEAEQLLKKMHVWNQVLENKKTLELQQAFAQEQRSLAYLQKRADGLCQEHIRHAAFSRIYTQTQEEVVAHFKNEKVHHDYLQAIIDRLPKGACRG